MTRTMETNRRLATAAALMLVLTSTAGPALAETAPADTYLVQPGDVLEISVWREEGLEKQVVVRPDGGLSFPLVGNVQASEKSVEKLQTEVAEKLKRYIPDPSVSVAVLKLDGNKIYVIGKVNRPGEFTATRNVDVVQALSMAGGMTPYAAANKIRILRRDGGKQTAIPFAYGEIEKGEDLEQNIPLKAGDVVVVP